MAYAGTHEMPSSVNIHSLMHMYDLVQPLTQLRLVHAAAYLYMLDTCSVGEGFPWKFTAMASTGFKELRAPPMLGLGNWISMYIPKIHHWWHCWIFQLHMKQWRGETPSIQCKKHTKAKFHARSLTARPSTNDTWKVPMFLLKWFLFRRTKSSPFFVGQNLPATEEAFLEYLCFRTWYSRELWYLGWYLLTWWYCGYNYGVHVNISWCLFGWLFFV